MRILNRYLTHDLLITFLMAFCVITLVMSIGVIFQAIDYIARGASAGAILKLFFYNMPFLMSFTLPMSLLVAVLLLFGKLSMEGELVAMQASGISIWEIVSPLIIISIVVTVFSATIASEVAPRCWYARRLILHELGSKDPVKLLESGRFIKDFPGFITYVGNIKGNELEDVIVYQIKNDKVVASVRAKTGLIQSDEEAGLVNIELYNARVMQPASDPPFSVVDEYPITFDLNEFLNRNKTHKKVSDYTLFELVKRINNIYTDTQNIPEEELAYERMTLVVQANKRLALSVACFAFTVLGIPLGIQSKRSESSVGIGIALLIVFIFYFFIILAESLVKTPHLRPDLIIWIPVILSEVIGFYLLKRHA